MGALLKSCPVWGAWIEMLGEVVNAVMTYVVPRMGRVD